jgi:hypothetical protein
MPPRRSGKKDSPAKLAGRMKRRWRVVLLRHKGEILGTVEAPDVASAKATAAIQFGLDEIQRDRIMGAGARLSDDPRSDTGERRIASWAERKGRITSGSEAAISVRMRPVFRREANAT